MCIFIIFCNNFSLYIPTIYYIYSYICLFLFGHYRRSTLFVLLKDICGYLAHFYNVPLAPATNLFSDS